MTLSSSFMPSIFHDVPGGRQLGQFIFLGLYDVILGQCGVGGPQGFPVVQDKDMLPFFG